MEQRRQDDEVGGSGTAGEGLSERARRWYEELKEEESAIAPWLGLEWTGERMRVRRG